MDTSASAKALSVNPETCKCKLVSVLWKLCQAEKKYRSKVEVQIGPKFGQHVPEDETIVPTLYELMTPRPEMIKCSAIPGLASRTWMAASSAKVAWFVKLVQVLTGYVCP